MRDLYDNDICRQCGGCFDEKFPNLRESFDTIFTAGCIGIPECLEDVYEESFLQSLTENDYHALELATFPLLWAAEELDWQPRSYQRMELLCTHKRRLLRWARRLGKSDLLALRGLHRAYTTGDINVLIAAPFLKQVENVFEKITKLANKSDAVSESIIRFVKTPNHEIKFSNDSKISGFTTGDKGDVARGQEAHFIICDEMDMMKDDAYAALYPMLTEDEEREFWGSSTPTGKRDKFYQLAHSTRYRESHHTGRDHPNYSPAIEQEQKDVLTESQFIHEFLAEWGEEEQGVFKHAFIGTALRQYDLEDMAPQPGWIYTIGVDWNKPKHGDQIIVVGRNPKGEIWLVAWHEISVQKRTHTTAVEKIIELNRYWRPSSIYLDAGYGEMAIETLHAYGLRAANTAAKTDKRALTHEMLADAKLCDIVRPIDFATKQAINDPLDGVTEEKHMKPFMVKRSVVYLEEKILRLPASLDISPELLVGQMRNFLVIRMSPTGMPVYTKEGMHTLIAYMLALLAFDVELTDIAKDTSPVQLRTAYPGKAKEKDKDDDEASNEKIKQLPVDRTTMKPSLVKEQRPKIKRKRSGKKHKDSRIAKIRQLRRNSRPQRKMF